MICALLLLGVTALTLQKVLYIWLTWTQEGQLGGVLAAVQQAQAQALLEEAVIAVHL
tara:strand:- start:220 stop:390 length:171 start_codon:yes stop_codon:yes gene_type:complete